MLQGYVIYDSPRNIKTVRAEFLSVPFILQKFNSFDELLWSNEKPWMGILVVKSNEKISIENLSFQCLIFKYGQYKSPYLEIFELVFFLKNSKKLTLVRFEPSTLRSLAS